MRILSRSHQSNNNIDNTFLVFVFDMKNVSDILQLLKNMRMTTE